MNLVRKLMKNISHKNLFVYNKESWLVEPALNLIF